MSMPSVTPSQLLQLLVPIYGACASSCLHMTGIFYDKTKLDLASFPGPRLFSCMKGKSMYYIGKAIPCVAIGPGVTLHS